MRILKQTDVTATARLPHKTGILNHIQVAYRELFQVLLKGGYGLDNDTSIQVIYGCVNDTSSGDNVISAGWVYYLGELYEVDAVTIPNPLTGSLVAVRVDTNVLAPDADPVIFTDGNPYNIHMIRKVAIIDGTNVSAGYIGTFASFVSPQANLNEAWGNQSPALSNFFFTGSGGDAINPAAGNLNWRWIGKKTIALNIGFEVTLGALTNIVDLVPSSFIPGFGSIPFTMTGAAVIRTSTGYYQAQLLAFGGIIRAIPYGGVYPDTTCEVSYNIIIAQA